MRKAFGGTKNRLLFPLNSHFGYESFIIFIEFEGDINRADEISNGIIFIIDIKQVISAV
jgi:hypothetical protein